MRNLPLKIALIQSNPVTGDLAGNMEAIEAAVAKAATLRANLCVAPELALCGRNAGDLLLQPGFVRNSLKVLDAAAQRLAQREGLPPLLLGTPVSAPGSGGKALRNGVVLLHEGKVTVVSCKALLSSGGSQEQDDRRYFEAGIGPAVVHINGYRLAVAVGADISDSLALERVWNESGGSYAPDLSNAGCVDALINLTALPFEQGLPARHQQLLGQVAARNRVPVAAANMVGGNDSLVCYGGSLAFDGSGDLVARAPAFTEDILVVDFAGTDKNFIFPEFDPEEELWLAIVLGTRDFARKCGFSSAVLGLSGGVDSSLVAAIAVEAFGPANVTGLLMPAPYSSPGSIKDSLTLAKKLGIQAHILPVTPMLDAFDAVFRQEFTGGLEGIAEENTQARIRSIQLMAFANRFGALVLATGNKSEAAVGYATLYGDLAGGLAPIGDLYKHQVYSLCRWYNAIVLDAIPEAVLGKAPSAELRPGQRDSDSLPPYEKLDPLLFEIIENRCDREQLLAKGYESGIVSKVLRLVKRAEFKRYQAPPSLHLSSRSFANGWSFPIAVTAKE